MIEKIRLSELARMNRTMRGFRLTEMTTIPLGLPSLEDLAVAEAEVLAWRNYHGVDLETALAQVDVGEREETWDMFQWIMAAHRLEKIQEVLKCRRASLL
jgi:hypothetical protein